MLPSKMNVNKKLLPMKGHYFFFNAGTAPLVPYLSSFARQLGFSSATVGLIYAVLPIFGLIAKPLFGVIADRFKKQKSIFIIFQIITIASFSAIYLIPEERTLTVGLDCNDGVSMLHSCYKSENDIDHCKITSINSLDENATTICRMNCDMTTPKMWQTVCEHWHIPGYCYSNTNNIQYSSSVSDVTLRSDNCTYIAVNNVTIDDNIFTSHCRLGKDFVDVNEPCALTCADATLAAAIGQEKVNMTCINNNINYRICSNTTEQIELAIGNKSSYCQASCDLDVTAPWRLMEICEWWHADVASYCQAKTREGEQFPANFSFDGVVKLSSALVEHDCVFMELKQIEVTDDYGQVSIHYPNCGSQSTNQKQSKPFQSSCEINCDNMLVNELIKGAMESNTDDNNRNTLQFWLFFTFMILSWIGQAVVVTFADTICFDLLGSKFALYGKQRMWGSVGWGVFSLLTGVFIDLLSEGAYKDYTIAFVLMFVFMVGDVLVSCFLETDNTKMSMNILADIGTLLSSLPTFIFLIWTVAVGLCTGLLWQFLFWLVEDIAGCDGSDYVKTLQGLVSAVQTFGGEIPFLFVSGYVLRKVGHVNMMTLVLFAFGVRFILYSFLSNPWLVLPVELFQGITFGMFYPTMTSYANIVSPPGTETTVQGLVGAIFEGVGTSLGSYIGGTLYDAYGGWNTFRVFGIGALICGVIHALCSHFLKDKLAQAGVMTGYSSVIRYEQPNDMVYMLEDMNEGRS